MTSSTNFSGPVKVQGRYVATLSADGSSLVDGGGNPADTQSALFRAAGIARNRTIKRFIDNVNVGASNSGTAATVSIDAASPFGRPAYKIAMPAGNTYHELTLTGLNIAAFDGHIVWRLWIEDYTALAEVRALAGTSGYGRYFEQRNLVSTSNDWRRNGEAIMAVGPQVAATTNSFVSGTDTMSDAKLRIFPGAGGANVWVDAVYVAGVGRPTHIITHDDASVTWINNCLPYLSAAGLTATFGISSGDIGGNPALYLSSAQVLQIANAGHQISPHNVSNTAYNDGVSGTQTAAQYTADFVTAQAALAAIVGNRMDPSYHPWVQGKNNSAVHATMQAAGMRIARSTTVGYSFPQIGLGNGALALQTQYLHTLTTGQITAICEAAKTYGLTVVWMVHEVTANGGAGVETAAAVYQHLINSVSADVRSGAAMHRTMAQFAREVYSERLVAASLLA